MSSIQEHQDIKKEDSWRMFNLISPKYDFLNRFLSIGQDMKWRRQLAQHIVIRKHHNVLDLATGTADVLLSLVEKNDNILSAYGVDMANKMLEIGRAKIEKKNLSEKIILKYGNINQIPVEDEQFDNVTIAFGIRNVQNPNQVLREMLRVLTPEGRAMILEFSLPKNAILRTLHLTYLRVIVPIIGGMISGNFKAYRYLNQTIETFPCGDAFCQLMDLSGFENVRAFPLMGGIATIYCGDKP